MLINSSVSVEAPLPYQLHHVNYTDTSSPAIEIWPGQSTTMQLVVSSTTDCCFEFGSSEMSEAAIQNSYLLLAGKRYLFEHDRVDTHFRVIRLLSNGVLSYYSPGSAVSRNLPPLPASAVEYWHSELNLSASAWVGQIGGRSLTGGGGATVARGGASYFNNRLVARCYASGAGWGATGMAELAAIATMPWSFVVYRLRTVPGDNVQHSIYDGGSGPSDGPYIIARGTTTELLQVVEGATVTGAAADTAVHTIATWLDGTNINLSVDGTVTSAARAGSLANAVDTFAIGCRMFFGPTWFADVDVAFALFCSSKPSVFEVAALRAWASTWWGAP